MTEDFYLCHKRPDGDMAKSTQWAITNNGILMDLSKDVRGKMHIGIYSMVAQDGERRKPKSRNTNIDHTTILLFVEFLIHEPTH